MVDDLYGEAKDGAKPWDLEAYRYDPETSPGEHRTVRARYEADGESLFTLSLLLGFVTVFTLGLGRFWMINRIRQHYWDAIEIDRDPLEYRGSALEKLLGFLIAVVILAVYLSIASLVMTFWGLASFDGDLGLAGMLGKGGLLLLVPLIFFAMYRSRRYVLARTRWRGIRFGMAPGAWRFMGLAMLMLAATVLSLGLLYPWQHFRLTKFMTDRTWFGNMRFHQDGTWRALMGYWALTYLALAVTAVALAVIAGTATLSFDDPVALAPFVAALMAGAAVVYAAWIRYRVAAFRYMWNTRTLGDIRFACDIHAGEIVAIKLAGQIGVQIASAVLASLMFGVLFLIFASAEGFEETARRIGAAFETTGEIGDFAFLAIAAILWFASSYAASFALTQVFLKRPILRRQVGSVSVVGAGHLGLALQRAHDDVAEAGGFADALDVSFGVGF